MADLKDLKLEVQQVVQGCPDPVIYQAINQAARRFCRGSGAWSLTETVYLAAGRTKTDVPTQNGADVVSLISVTKNDKMATAWTDDLETLEFQAAPSITTAYEVKVSLAPSRGKYTIGDNVLANWGEDIAHGAIALLLMQKNRPWHDPQLSGYHNSLFRKATIQAKQYSAGVNASANQRVNPHPFI